MEAVGGVQAEHARLLPAGGVMGIDHDWVDRNTVSFEDGREVAEHVDQKEGFRLGTEQADLGQQVGLVLFAVDLIDV